MNQVFGIVESYLEQRESFVLQSLNTSFYEFLRSGRTHIFIKFDVSRPDNDFISFSRWIQSTRDANSIESVSVWVDDESAHRIWKSLKWIATQLRTITILRKTIGFDDLAVECSNVKTLIMQRGCSVKDASTWQVLGKTLETLDVDFCYAQNDIDTQSFSRLKSLTVRRKHWGTLLSLCMNTLHSLTIECGNFNDGWGSLGNATSLRSLSLTNCSQLHTLDGLERLTGLTSLEVSQTSVFHECDFKALRSCSRLQEVTFRATELSETMLHSFALALSCMPDLRKLDVSENYDIEEMPLGSYLRNLRELAISFVPKDPFLFAKAVRLETLVIRPTLFRRRRDHGDDGEGMQYRRSWPLGGLPPTFKTVKICASTLDVTVLNSILSIARAIPQLSFEFVYH
jgi:hypothetical protein